MLLVILALFWGITAGPFSLGLAQVAGILLNKINIETTIPYSAQQEAVLWAIRFPRAIMGLVVGSALAVSGVVLQSIFRSPFAEPALLGVSSGAVAGVVLGILTGLVGWSIAMYPVAAFVGSFLMTIALYTFSNQHGRVNTTTLVLTGIAAQVFLAAVITVVTSMSKNPAIRDVSFWTMGGLSGATLSQVWIGMSAVIVATLLMCRLAPKLNVLALGETEAEHLGVDTFSLRLKAIALLSVATGTAVAFSGTIAFVGLVVPHILRIIVGPDHRLLLPASALAGAFIVATGDVLARTLIAPMELPIGVLMTLIGGPLFFYLINRARREGVW